MFELKYNISQTLFDKYVWRIDEVWRNGHKTQYIIRYLNCGSMCVRNNMSGLDYIECDIINDCLEYVKERLSGHDFNV